MPNNSADLVNIFQTVTQALAQNQQALDEADTYNHDHGSNMVQTFETITSALEKKQTSSNSAALAYAAKKLAKSTTSGSGKLYADNLNTAAAQFKGRQMDERGALDLLQTLIGSQSGQQSSGGGDMLGALLGGMAGNDVPQQQGPSGGGDLLGALLGGMAGNAAPQQQAPSAGSGDMLGMLLGGLTGEAPAPQAQSQPAAGDDMLGMLLGGLTGASGSQGQQGAQSGQGELGLQNLLAGGLAYLQAKQSGQGNMQAIIQALAAGSGMGNTTHRTESTQVVIQAFLQALSAMNKPS